MVDYTNSVIYCIYCVDPNIKDIYIGSTTNLHRRLIQHKYNSFNTIRKEYNQSVYKIIRKNGGWYNWTFVELEYAIVETKIELHKLEKKWIDDLKPSLNTQKPTRTRKEHYRDNAERIKKLNKIYSINNAVKIREYKKHYYIINKQKKQKQKQKFLNNFNKVGEI
tara:strand:+ start:238 stop:732 length:495 start_codon:yes stop_codon:yes gene_type:complete